jgi:anthranilate/para-aminobenzoate synthase component II
MTRRASSTSRRWSPPRAAFKGLEGVDLAKDVSCTQSYRWDEMRWAWPEGYPPARGPRAQGRGARLRRETQHPALPRQRGLRRHRHARHHHGRGGLAQNPDGVFLSNGPGDPAATGDYAVPMIKGILETDLPVFGICLGHQMLALALGAKTVKMNHGHHGANHPVKDLETGKVEITSMNHGFTVDSQTLPEGVIETHVSLFDGSNCGIRMTDRPVFSVQYHPEASPGPQDSFYLFERFAAAIRAGRAGKRLKATALSAPPVNPLLTTIAQCPHDSSGLWRHMDGDQIDRPVALGAQPRAVPLVRPDRRSRRDAASAPRPAPEPAPFDVETRAADAILARMLIDDRNAIPRRRRGPARRRRGSSTCRWAHPPDRGRVDEPTLLERPGRVHGAPVLTLGHAARSAPCPSIPRDLALRAEAVPVHAEDGTMIVATARPDLFDLVNAGPTTEDAASTWRWPRARTSCTRRRSSGARRWRGRRRRARRSPCPAAHGGQPRAAWGFFALTVLLIAEALFPAQVALVAFGDRGPGLHREHHAQGAAFSRCCCARDAAGRRAQARHRAAPAAPAGGEHSRPDVRGARDRRASGHASVAHALPAGAARYPAPAGGG